MTANEMAARLRAEASASVMLEDMGERGQLHQIKHPQATRGLFCWAADATETLDPLRGIGFGTDCGCRMCVATRRIDPLLAELAKLLEK